MQYATRLVTSSSPEPRKSQKVAASQPAALAIIVLVCLSMLVACSSEDPLEPTPEPVQWDTLVEVNLTPVGAPLTVQGKLEPLHLVITVHNQNGDLVHFDNHHVASLKGDNDSLQVEAGVSSLKLFLFEGNTYSFEALAFDASNNLLAYGTAQRTVTSGNNALMLDLDALLGAAHLEKRLPIHKLLPGQELDLLLTLTPRKRDDLTIATDDYQASYDLTNGTSLFVSKRGVRVRVGERADGDLVVKATAEGLRLTASDIAQNSISTSIRIPFSSGIGTDLENPVVSTLAFDAVQQIFTGVADDNLGVVKLEIYDGPTLLASTDLEKVEAKNIAQAFFPGGGTAFLAQLDLSPGDYTLTVYASDATGNQGEASLDITVPVTP